MDDLIGKSLLQYRIVDRLGEGGMATVYRGVQASVGREVAVKVLPRALASDPDFTTRFKREAMALAQLQHPNILQVIDFGEADGYAFFVMPLMRGGTLADLIRRGPMPIELARKFAAQVAEALAYAHARGLVHRDVKPGNVLLDDSGNAQLSDFGLVQLTKGAVHLTRTGAIIGTPTYMSPEQGNGTGVDHRADIYALGVMLFEMLTGRVPYEADTPVQVLVKHVVEPVPALRSVNPSLSKQLEQVCNKVLAKNPAERYQSAGEFVQALYTATGIKGVSTPLPLPVQPPTPAGVGAASGSFPRLSTERGMHSLPGTAVNQQEKKRRSPLIALLALLALGLAGCAALFAFQGGMAMFAPPATATPTPVERATSTPFPALQATSTPEPASRSGATATIIPTLAAAGGAGATRPAATVTSQPATATSSPVPPSPTPQATATRTLALPTRTPAPPPQPAPAPTGPTATPAVSPTPPTYAPINLLGPASGYLFNQNNIPAFSWSSAGPLAPGHYYRLVVVHSSGVDVICTNQTSAQGRPYIAQLNASSWSVAVVNVGSPVANGSSCGGTVLISSPSRPISGQQQNSPNPPPQQGPCQPGNEGC